MSAAASGSARTIRRIAVSIESGIALVLSAAVLVYLVYTLLRPEKF